MEKSNPPPPSRTADQFVVRFPDGMRDLIAETAKANNRSMNAEIIARLEKSFLSSQDLPYAKAVEMSAILESLKSSLMEIGKNEKVREEMMMSVGSDLDALARALPNLDESMLGKFAGILGELGRILATGDYLMAQRRSRAMVHDLMDHQRYNEEQRRKALEDKKRVGLTPAPKK